MHEETREKIDAVLTPEQQDKLAELKEKRKERWEERKEKWMEKKAPARRVTLRGLVGAAEPPLPQYRYNNARRIIRQQLAQIGGKPGGIRPVNHPVVIRQTQRQHQPGLELLPIPYRLHVGTADSQDCHFRPVHNGR